MKPRDKISTYNIEIIYYTFQLGWENSVLCHCYYQSLSNQIQDPIFTWKLEKPTLFQNIYILTIIITRNMTVSAIVYSK